MLTHPLYYGLFGFGKNATVREPYVFRSRLKLLEGYSVNSDYLLLLDIHYSSFKGGAKNHSRKGVLITDPICAPPKG